MTRALGTLAAAALLGLLLASCGSGGDGADDRIEACADEVAAAVLDPIAPDEEPGPELMKAAEALCRDAEAQGALEDETVARNRTSDLFRKHGRSLLAPVCDLFETKVREAMPAEALNYVTDADFRSFARGWCAFANDYFRDNASLDVERLLSDHPEIGTPICAGGVHASLAEAPETLIPKRNFRAFGEKLCRRLFEEKLVAATGPGQFRLRTESPKYDRVARETVQEFAR
jgi:hypothetical protein